MHLDLVDSYLDTIKDFLIEISKLDKNSIKYMESINIAKINLGVYKQYILSALRPNI